MENETPSVADLVNLLFEVIRRPDGKRYTEQQVSEKTGIYDKTINAIRTGKTSNPGIITIRKLSNFFEVPLNYFNATSLAECYGILEQKRDNDNIPSSPFNEIALRSMHLSERTQRDVLLILEWVQATEQDRRAKLGTENNEASQSA